MEEGEEEGFVPVEVPDVDVGAPFFEPGDGDDDARAFGAGIPPDDVCSNHTAQIPAVVSNGKGDTMDHEEFAMSFLKNRERPIEQECPECEGALVHITHMLGGPWSGHVKCRGCGFCETVCGFLGKQMITVTPLEESDED